MSDQDETLKALLKEQQRANTLLERIADRPVAPPKKSWMCDAGRSGTCYGPFYVCAIFGCAIR